MANVAALLLVTATVAAASSPGFVTYDSLGGMPYAVTYDGRSLMINGNRTIFTSGCVHYPRATPGMWPDLMKKARNDGFNMVQTYFFWNMHQHKEGEWTFDFNGDVRGYLEAAAAEGLFVSFRIGPYICGEWNNGGFPVWLDKVANLTTRSSNPQWQELMQGVYYRIVAELRDLMADRGGPIALLQVENEYAEWACNGAIGTCDQSYVNWAGDMAAGAGVENVPVLMCNGYSAPNTISTCNGNDCASFLEKGGGNSRVLQDQPGMWTENEMWFSSWGMPFPDYVQLPEPFAPPQRTPENLAYSVARYFARGGSHHNYYMWYGSPNFGRMAGSSVAQWYANGGNVNSDTLPNEPLRSHMQALHWLLVNNAAVLLGSPAQVWNRTYLDVYQPGSGEWVPGDNSTIAFVYSNAAGCLQFVENSQALGTPALTLRFPGITTPTWVVAAGSNLILDCSGTVLYNTSVVATPPVVNRSYTPLPGGPLQWAMWQDNLVSSAPAPPPLSPPGSTNSTVGRVINATAPLEQLSVTEDDSEYMLYSRVVSSSEVAAIWSGVLAQHDGDATAATAAAAAVPLTITSQLAQAFIVFASPANGVGPLQYVGDAYDFRHNFVINSTTRKFDGHWDCVISLNLTAYLLPGATAGPFTLSLLSESLGIDNGHGAWVVNGTAFSTKGIAGDVTLGGVSIASGGVWKHTIGLGGEAAGVFAAAGAAAVAWTPVSTSAPPPAAAVTWYRTFFTTPSSLLAQMLSSPPASTTSAAADTSATAGNAVATSSNTGGSSGVSSAARPEVMTSLLLDIGSSLSTVGRGHVYINGFDIGRYWNIVGYNTTSPGQRWYALPPDLLVPDVPGGNTLTLVDVVPGTNLAPVRLVTSTLVPA